LKYFHDLPIKTKLLSVFSLILFLFVIVIGYNLYSSNLINNRLNQIVASGAEKIKLAARINQNVLEIARAEKNILLSQEEEDVEGYASFTLSTRKEMQMRRERLHKLSDEKGKKLIYQFSIVWERYLLVNQQIIMLSKLNSMDSAIILSSSEGRQLIDKAQTLMGAIVAHNETQLDRHQYISDQILADSSRNTLIFLSGILVISITTMTLIAQHLSRRIIRLMDSTAAIAAGNLLVPIEKYANDEVGDLSDSIRNMQQVLHKVDEERSANQWRSNNLVQLNTVMEGGQIIMNLLATKIIEQLCHSIDAKLGTLYIVNNQDDSNLLELASGYGFSADARVTPQFLLGEGLVGQAAKESQPLLLDDIPEDYIKIRSSLGETVPRHLALFPCHYEEGLIAVIEFGLLQPLDENQLAYLTEAMYAVGAAIVATQTRVKLKEALLKSQASAEEAQAQQEEMEVLNEELEEHNQLLGIEKKKVEQAQHQLQKKVDELAQSIRYKSEFLTNMSHELRTPLNSLLLLSRGLANNKTGNLNDEQVEFAQVIYQSGNDLLAMINAILDLSKIDAGHMAPQLEPLLVKELAEALRLGFQHVAADKGLELQVRVESESPESIQSDRMRLEQILKNLLSNAMKFTEKGRITLSFAPVPSDKHYALAISVTDTGIGIAKDDQERIFEEFQQIDGSISRKYAGIGLGLTISQRMVDLLGGEIQLVSEADQGASFIVLLPQQAPPITTTESDVLLKPMSLPLRPEPAVIILDDDRKQIKPSDRSLLIIEDDMAFAKILMSAARERNFKSLVAGTGEAGLELALIYRPDAILLDMMLPGMNGLQVLGRLKGSIDTRHIPVHIISVHNPDPNVLIKGAIGYQQKPVSAEDLKGVLKRLETVIDRKTRNILVVEDNRSNRKAIIKLIGTGIIHSDEAATGAEALQALSEKKYDCMILDLGLSDMDGEELLEQLSASEIESPPVIIYTGRELSHEDEMKLRAYTDSIIIKDVRSEERLLDEVMLFLHRVVADLPDQSRSKIELLYNNEALLQNKKILVVDDDMRTLFALTSILSEQGMQVLKAERGEKALTLLEENTDIDLVLMDIMMPELDGYQTIQHIRKQARFSKLPIIALTALAMPQDREKCLQAGANDYMAKPVDKDGLISLLRIWLYR
jgi:CheY-like chemotaxis protein/HAMP domain-containing protein